MKGKFFFIDDNNKEIEIQEFDYKYVRNAFLKEFDKNVSKKYIFNVIVSKQHDSSGLPIFDVRPLNLKNIYYDNVRLNALKMMTDDIYFGKDVKVQNLPMPPLQQEYKEYLEGRVTLQKQTEASVPAPIVFERKEIAEDDSRLTALTLIESNIAIDPMKALDWIVNFEVCSAEIGASTQRLSDDQIKLVTLLKNNSDYIHGVFDNLTKVLEQIFPLKPTFTQRMFGKKDIEINPDDLPNILTRLRTAVNVDSNRFVGLTEIFKDIQDGISELKETVEHGVVGCQYMINTIEDSYEFSLRQERLMKIRVTSDITEMSLVSNNKRFIADLNRLKEVQEVMVPLLIIRLQDQQHKKVDDETVSIIRSLAYRGETKTTENVAQPPKKP